MDQTDFDVAIIGAGPAGSTAASYLARAGLRTALFEMKKFPREVICGEFLSVEVTTILQDLNIYDEFKSLNPKKIENFSLVFDDGKKLNSSLGFDGYAIKRSVFDEFLLNKAKESGARVLQPAKVNEIVKENGHYRVIYNNLVVDKILTATNVIIAYGKQNALDKKIERTFADKKTSLNGIKFHVEKKLLNDVPEDTIEIFTGNNIYCGLNTVDDETVTICALESSKSNGVKPRQHLKELIKSNSEFSKLFNADFEKIIDEMPIYGCGNVYFGERSLVERGMFAIGDAAEVIAPLTGDGIGIAMQSGKLISEILLKQKESSLPGDTAENIYKRLWKKEFSRRLKTAHKLQNILLNKRLKKLGYRVLKINPFLLKLLIRSTRGEAPHKRTTL